MLNATEFEALNETAKYTQYIQVINDQETGQLFLGFLGCIILFFAVVIFISWVLPICYDFYHRGKAKKAIDLEKQNEILSKEFVQQRQRLETLIAKTEKQDKYISYLKEKLGISDVTEKLNVIKRSVVTEPTYRVMK